MHLEEQGSAGPEAVGVPEHAVDAAEPAVGQDGTDGVGAGAEQGADVVGLHLEGAAVIGEAGVSSSSPIRTPLTKSS